MKHVVNPVKCDVGRSFLANAFVSIEIKSNGSLSMSAVIGPTRNGNALGSCGQCIDEIRNGEPEEGWTKDDVNKLCDIWEEWHLNDMRPYCEHQKKLEWDKIAKERVNIYHFTLDSETTKKRSKIKELAWEAVKKGEKFTPSKEQTLIANLEWEVKKYNDNTCPEFYKEAKNDFRNSTSTLGWIRPKEYEKGILTKPCPVCGYKYGTEWKKEELPKDVVDWLVNTPSSKIQPAWI